VASELDHIALANKNHAALLYLLKCHTQHPEWTATVAFYKAVQVTEAVLANRWNRHSHDHAARLDHIKRVLPPKYYTHFRVLYQESKLARYLEDSDGQSFRRFTDHMNADAVVSELVGKRLNGVEQLALPMLSDGAKTALTKLHLPDLPVPANP